MPTYAYRCPVCGHEFDLWQNISDPGGAACPACGSPAEHVITGGGGLLFKGEGFHLTDYRSESYKKSAKSEGGAGSEPSGGTSEGAAEKVAGSKPAPKNAKEKPAATEAKNTPAQPPKREGGEGKSGTEGKA